MRMIWRWRGKSVAQLLFEIWEGPNGLECGAVSEDLDRNREDGMALREAFLASSWVEAMTERNRGNGWEPYVAAPGLDDVAFAGQQRADQDAHLKVRDPEIAASKRI